MTLDIHSELEQVMDRVEILEERLKLTEAKLRNALAENAVMRQKVKEYEACNN